MPSRVINATLVTNFTIFLKLFHTKKHSVSNQVLFEMKGRLNRQRDKSTTLYPTSNFTVNPIASIIMLVINARNSRKHLPHWTIQLGFIFEILWTNPDKMQHILVRSADTLDWPKNRLTYLSVQPTLHKRTCPINIVRYCTTISIIVRNSILCIAFSYIERIDKYVSQPKSCK